jgi:hypothetical protein
MVVQKKNFVTVLVVMHCKIIFDRPLGRPRRRWEDNIKMDLQEVGCGGWTGLIWLSIGTGGGHL